MKLLGRKKAGIADKHRRLVWQSVSLLLAYPEETAGGLQYADRLDMVAGILDELPPAVGEPPCSVQDWTSQRTKPTMREASVMMAIIDAAPRIELSTGRRIG